MSLGRYNNRAGFSRDDDLGNSYSNTDTLVSGYNIQSYQFVKVRTVAMWLAMKMLIEVESMSFRNILLSTELQSQKRYLLQELKKRRWHSFAIEGIVMIQMNIVCCDETSLLADEKIG